MTIPSPTDAAVSPRRGLISRLVDIFLSGLLTFLPVVATVAAILWLWKRMDGIFGAPFRRWLSDDLYWAGMGIASFLALVFLLGLLTRFWIVRAMIHWIGGVLNRVPLVKTVYGGLKDISDFIFKPAEKNDGRAVVMVTLQNGWKQIGIVTRADYQGLSAAFQAEMRLAESKPDSQPDSETSAVPEAAPPPNMIAVYFPFSYQIGGYTYFVDPATARPLAGMTVEDAMRYSVMAWMAGKPKS